MESEIFLPEPILSPNRTVANFVDNILSKKGESTLKWVGNVLITQVIYIYFFKKYGHECFFTLTIRGRNDTEHLGRTIRFPSAVVSQPQPQIPLPPPLQPQPVPVQFIQETADSDDMFMPPSADQSAGKSKRMRGRKQKTNKTNKINNYKQLGGGDLTELSIYETAADSFIKCYDKGIPLIICPLSIKNIIQRKNTWVDSETEEGHANLLIFRRSTQTFELFEPHGSEFREIEWADAAISNFVRVINSKYSTNFRYIPIEDVCPQFGVQLIEEAIKGKTLGEGGGYCAAWSLFFTELVLTNPELSQREITEALLESTEVTEENRHVIGNKLRTIIRGYVYLIYEIIDNYFMFLFEARFKSTKEVFLALSYNTMLIPEIKKMNTFLTIFITIHKLCLENNLSITQFIELVLPTLRENPNFEIFETVSRNMKDLDVVAEAISDSEVVSGGKRKRKSRKTSRRTSKRNLKRKKSRKVRKSRKL